MAQRINYNTLNRKIQDQVLDGLKSLATDRITLDIMLQRLNPIIEVSDDECTFTPFLTIQAMPGLISELTNYYL